MQMRLNVDQDCNLHNSLKLWFGNRPKYPNVFQLYGKRD